MFCPYCGDTLQDGAKRCLHCGRELNQSSIRAISSSGGSDSGKGAQGQGSSVSSVICESLHQLGPEALQDSRRLVSLVMDKVPESNSVGTVFISNCDNEYIEIFRQALTEGTADAIGVASARAERLLIDDRSIVERVSRMVSYETARGVALYLGVDCPDPPSEERAPSKGDSARVSELPGDTLAHEPVPRRVDGARLRQTDGALQKDSGQKKTVFCTHCGAENLDTDKFCTKCGEYLIGRMPVGANAHPNLAQSNNAQLREATSNDNKTRSGSTLVLTLIFVALLVMVIMLSYFIIVTDG